MQLVTASTNWGYSYDANGNRIASVAGATTRGYSVSATSNRLDALTSPARNLGYDTVGNTLSDVQAGSSANYTGSYSLEGRLTGMAQGSSAGVEFGYDALGRRVTRQQWMGSPSNPRAVTIYAYDQDNHLLGEYQADGTPVTEYVWLGDTPVAIVKTDPNNANATTVYAIHADHLETPRVILDASGQVRWRWMGEPFGASPAEEQPTSGLAALQQNLRFPGQQYETFGGRHYNHFRDYDPTTGRYVQSDPIGLAGGINTYIYVEGNPLSDVDSSGLQGRAPPPRPSPNIITNAQALNLITQIQQVNPQFRYPPIISAAGQGGYGASDVQFLARALARAQAQASCNCSTGNSTWPTNPQEMDEILGVPGVSRPDGPLTQGRGTIIWRPSSNLTIKYECHRYDTTAPTFHQGPHWHVEGPPGANGRPTFRDTFVPTELMPK